MSELDQIVSISISANSKTPTREGFGTPVIMTYHTRFADSYRVYEDLAGMASDGFATTDPAYLLAAAVFSQDPAPAQVVVGRLSAAPSVSWTIKVTDATEGHTVGCIVVSPDGTETECYQTVGAASSVNAEATALEPLIEAVTGVNSTVSTDTVTATAAAAGTRFWIHSPEGCEIKETTADAGYDDALTALAVVNDDWYWVLTDCQSETNIDLVAAWALANKKIYVACTNATDELTGTGVLGAGLLAASNDRVALVHVPESRDYACGALAGIGGSRDPGSITFAYKELKGVTAGTLTATQRTNLETDNINHYQTVAGVNILRDGVLASGEYIDIRHGIDALESDLKTEWLGVLVNADKVPFTDAGIDLVKGTILGVLQRYEASGFLTPGSSTVTAPLASAVLDANKAARTLPSVKFSATLQGAIHKITVVGTLTV